MRYALIFGGTGFIGRHVAIHLRSSADPWKVVLADIEPPNDALPEGVTFSMCDVRDRIDDGLGTPDLIVNLAAVHRTPGHPDHEYHETNERGARNVTEFAARKGVERIWFTSSIAVYGPDEEVKTEQSEPRPVSAYGKSKLEAERIHEEWARGAAGRRLVIARPATVFGSGEGGNFTRLAKAMKRRAFFYPGRRDTLKACGYVKDLAPSFEFMEQFADPVALYNFAYPEPPTIEEVCEAFAEAGKMPRPRVTVPAGLLLGVGRALNGAGLRSFNPERIAKLMHSTNIEGEELVGRGYRFTYPLMEGLQHWHAAPPSGDFV